MQFIQICLSFNRVKLHAMRSLLKFRKLGVLSFLVLTQLVSCQQGGSSNYSWCYSSDNCTFPKVRALMASRFKTLDEFREVVGISYINTKMNSDSMPVKGQSVVLTYVDRADTINNILDFGVTQGDMIKVRDGSYSNRAKFAIFEPYSVANRVELNEIYKLARRRPRLFGVGDVAFYDLALASVSNIRHHNESYKSEEDSSEKGYVNTYNHITAQALITTLYGVRIADYIADLHERYAMPHLLTGKFSVDELTNPNKNAVDNYVDLINNKIGQELGLALRDKHKITQSTVWTSNLLANYLNEIQSYYSYSFGVGHKPFPQDHPTLEMMARKINKMREGVPFGIE